MKYQCYYKDKEGVRCLNYQKECWCSELHKQKWQEKEYPQKIIREKRKEVTITDLQQKLLDIKKNLYIKENSDENGQIKLIPKANKQINMLDH